MLDKQVLNVSVRFTFLFMSSLIVMSVWFGDTPVLMLNKV
uniref:Uncharacterized protein n=1 Tax=Setaria italica TaxID=4555 RepID=K4AND4_SETIT